MGNYIYVPVTVSAVVAFLCVNWLYFKILKIAFDKNIVDNPDARKLQKTPVPVMGGLAVYFGILAGILLGAMLHAIVQDSSSTRLIAVLCSTSIMLYVGTVDDIIGLTPTSRLVIEIFTMVGLIYSTGVCIDTFRGMWGVYEINWWIAVPLTVITGVGIINAVNMIDGVNGLSSGLCMLCCTMFGIVFIKGNDTPNAVLAFATVGALMPFFIHNVFGDKSRMFIGDAGTMVMGILLTWFVMCTLSNNHIASYFHNANDINPIALCLAILSVPIFDTLRVMGMRIAHKKNPFSPDKTHLHHIFINVGVSHFITAMSEILIDFVVVVIWAASIYMGFGYEAQLYIVILASVLLVWGTYIILSYHAKNHTNFMHSLTEFSIRTHFGRKEWWKKLSSFLDSPGDYSSLNFVDEENYEAIDARFQNMDPENFKEIDRKKIFDFMKGRAEVLVQDIMDNSGAEKLRVYNILFEEKMNGTIIVLRENEWGAPKIVALSQDMKTLNIKQIN